MRSKFVTHLICGPIQVYQNITLPLITCAPCYINNLLSLHKDIDIITVEELASVHYRRFHSQLN